ncbi:hypothetical protein RJ639_021944 [Escallonia herrerae]|uniref:RNase H type-1 domain-containing protein n=1 Tax=Escallonia herrerae TaxID=1293975 RepID=A0AA88V3S7_9ASTE|nr:hypothetical protein RJ639_021944 [Escallonia herrerae]
MQSGEPVEDLISIEVFPREKEKTVRICSNLKKDTKLELVNLLRTYVDIFAWTTTDIPGIDPKKKRTLALERHEKIEDEVDKLLTATFIEEIYYPDWIANVVMVPQLAQDPYVDDSSVVGSSGAGIILISPKGFAIEYALRFGFQASNNEAKYETLLMGIRLAHALKVDSLSVYSDSQFMVNHVLGDYEARDERMVQYIQLMKTLASKFKQFTVH